MTISRLNLVPRIHSNSSRVGLERVEGVAIAAGSDLLIGNHFNEAPRIVELKIIKIENSMRVRLPREVLSRLHVEYGDRVILTEAPEGGYRLTPFDPEFEQQMNDAEEGMRRYRNTLKALA